MKSEHHQTLHELAALSVDGWTEADVREEFIAPLLRLLGYRKTTDYDVNRENEHLLAKPFLMIGSKKQKVDYALAVRRRTFWLLEAKRPTPARISDEAIFQAHFYAMHPEVQARFFGVCNGREIVLYDIRKLDDDYLPLLRVSAADLPTRFGEVANVIGARALVKHLKQRAIEDIEAVLSTEILEENVDSFSAEVRRVLREVKPVVRENRRAVWRKAFDEQERTFRRFLEEENPNDIASVVLEFARNNLEFELAYEAYARDYRAASKESQAASLRKLFQLLDQPLYSRHRYNVLRMLLRLQATFTEDQRHTLVEFVRDAIRGFEKRRRLAALGELEVLVHRTVYKLSFASPALLDDFNAMVQKKNQLMTDEELVWHAPSVWSERNQWVALNIDALWCKLSRASTGNIDGIVEELATFDAHLDTEFGEAIRSGTAAEGDLNFFGDYGKPWDYIRSLLFGTLNLERNAAYSIVDDEDIAYVGRLLSSVSTEYVVNGAGPLWLRHTARRGAIHVPDSLLDLVQERIPSDRIQQFFEVANAYRKGISPVHDGMRLSGSVGSGHIELDVRLDLREAQIVVEAARHRE